MRDEPSPFRTLVWIRVALWLGTAATLLWAPLRRGISPLGAYGGLSDLVFGTFAQWDSVWFIHVADHGYDSDQVTAYFPLYPLVVRAVAVVTRSTVVAGVLVSLAAAGAAAMLLARLARPLLGERGAHDAVLYLALYPIAFVFTSVYSEGLFLAAAIGSFLAATRGRPWAAGVLGGLAVLTRATGLALLPSLALLLWRRRRRDVVPLALLPAALGGYMLYLRHARGDALAFAHVQSIYWNRHTPTLGPLGGLWEAVRRGWEGAAEVILHLPARSGYPAGFGSSPHLGFYNAAHLALLAAAVWLTWEAWRRLGAAYGLYSALAIAAVLGSTDRLFPLVGLPRYLLADFPLFLALAALTRDRPRARTAVVVAFAAAGAAAGVAFSRRAWVS